MPQLIKDQNTMNIDIKKAKEPKWRFYEGFFDKAPSFLDSSQMINANLTNETVIEALIQGQCVGFIIYQPALGRISQLGVNPKMRRKGIGSALMSYARQHSLQKKMTIINVNDESFQTKAFFEALGFHNQIDQYEMILSL